MKYYITSIYESQHQTIEMDATSWLNAIYLFYKSHGMKYKVVYAKPLDSQINIVGKALYIIKSKFDDGSIHKCSIHADSLFQSIYDFYCSHGFRYEIVDCEELCISNTRSNNTVFSKD